MVRCLWCISLISTHGRQRPEDKQFKIIHSYIKSNYLCPEIIKSLLITISLMKSYVFEVIRNVYSSHPRYNRTERHFPNGVLKAMKRGGEPYSPYYTIVSNLKYFSREIIP